MIPLRRWAAWIGLGVTLLVLPGCWDYQSISTRAALVGIGIDPVENDPSQVRITVEYPLLSQGGSSIQSTGGPQTSTTQMYKNLTEVGYSLSEVLRHVQLRMDKNIDTSQLRCIVFSQKLAPQTLDAMVGELIRESKINRLAYVATTPGSALDILKVKSAEGAPMDVLDKAFSYSIRQYGYYVRKQLWEYWRDTVQFGKTPLMPTVMPGSTADGSNDTLKVEGLTVYQHNRPTTRLTRQETLNVNLLDGMVRDMGMNVPLPQGIVALSDVRAHSRLSIAGSPPHLHVIDKVTILAIMGKSEGAQQQPEQPTDLNLLQAQTAKYFTKQLNATMAKLQQHGADIFGFGAIYLQHHPDQVNVVKSQWEDAFRHATPEIQVKVQVATKGMLI